MAFIDKIYVEVENKIFDSLVEQNPEFTRKDFKSYKKTSDYKTLFAEKSRERFIELQNSDENRKIIAQLGNDKILSTDEMFSKIQNSIVRILSENRVYFYLGNSIHRLRSENIDELVKKIDSKMFLFEVLVSNNKNNNLTSFYDIFFKDNKFIFNYYSRNYTGNINTYFVTENFELRTVKEYIEDIIIKKYTMLTDKVTEYFTSDVVLRILFASERYKQLKNVYQIKTLMINEIPTDFTELYPQARLLKRHFILHIGDTNTGKTYQAIQELKSAESGTYLAPLRLLALEIQERLNNEGTPCSMTTGEEEDIIEGAKHMSSTIEKLNIDKYYDVCVIDEAQMIEDNDRGWAWTTAILGAYSERIHVCMSENAKDIVIRLIKLCKDTYEIVDHTRNTELVFEEKNFNFKNSIKEHDALIVFSRKKVLSVATALKEMGIKASVIYGALPYSVRKNEIRKFVEGETSVVVSTDAIGMGMNLPIKRVVFLESTKYDGRENRYLKGPEVKQIAGRAGRRGMFDTGYVNAMVDSKMIEKTLFEPYKPIQYARIQLPKSLLSINLPLSDIMQNWIKIPDNGCFRKSTIEQDLKLCKMLESSNVGLTKETMLDLINIPFDEGNSDLEYLWYNLIMCHFNNGDILTDMDIPMPRKNDSLDSLELKYKKLDLFFSFARTVNYNKNDFLKNIMNLKEELSIEIMEKLKTKETYRTCKYCGKKLPWDSSYSSCDSCFKKYKWFEKY